MKNPKVAVIIPVYNAKDYLFQAIDSVLLQDYDGFIEIIIVDNESTDQTFEEIKVKVDQFSFMSHYPWPIREIKCYQAPNVYKYSWHEPTRLGLEHIDDAEYFMFMAADDLLESKFISNNIKIFNKFPQKIKAIQSPVRFFGAWNHEQGHHYSSMEEFKEKMLVRSVVNTPTIMWHRSFNDQGLMDLAEPDKYYGADDYALYCELATRGHFIFPAPKYLGYKYRIHSNNASWGMHEELDSPNTIDKEIQRRFKKIWNSSEKA